MIQKILIALTCLLSGALHASTYNITAGGTYNLNVNATGTSQTAPAVLVDVANGAAVTINGTIHTDNFGVVLSNAHTGQNVTINNTAFGEDGAIDGNTYGYFVYADHAASVVIHNCSFTGGGGV
jgi:hypothetical protein